MKNGLTEKYATREMIRIFNSSNCYTYIHLLSVVWPQHKKPLMREYAFMQSFKRKCIFRQMNGVVISICIGLHTSRNKLNAHTLIIKMN